MRKLSLREEIIGSSLVIGLASFCIYSMFQPIADTNIDRPQLYDRFEQEVSLPNPTTDRYRQIIGEHSQDRE